MVQTRRKCYPAEMRPSEQDLDSRITVTGIRDCNRGSFIAAAFRSPSMTVTAFYEALTGQDGKTHLLSTSEVRVRPTPRDAPDAVPLEVLEEALALWVAEEGNEEIDYGAFEERRIGDLPFRRMWQMASAAFFADAVEGTFDLPTDDDFALARSSGDLFDYRTQREFDAAVEQLKAVATYLEAVAEGDSKPLQRVTVALGLPEGSGLTRARNVIQFARQNGLLTKARPGHAGGSATREAIELCDRIRYKADEMRKSGTGSGV